MDPRGVAFTMEDASKGILDLLGIEKPVINLTGCPTHPDWVFFDNRRSYFGKK
jgi:Ni,Fe-hydrogenase I small subunit